MELLRIIGIYPETISDGYGLRYRSISRGARTVVPAATTPRATIPGGASR